MIIKKKDFKINISRCYDHLCKKSNITNISINPLKDFPTDFSSFGLMIFPIVQLLDFYTFKFGCHFVVSRIMHAICKSVEAGIYFRKMFGTSLPYSIFHIPYSIFPIPYSILLLIFQLINHIQYKNWWIIMFIRSIYDKWLIISWVGLNQFIMMLMN